MLTKLPVENYKGCLVGGAIGDALGAPVEFMTTSQIISKFGQNGITDFVEFPGNIGEFTDDTQMTLFTAEGLLRAWHRAMLKGIEGAMHQIVHESYLRWLHTQGGQLIDGKPNKGMREKENGWLIRRNELFKLRAPGNTCLSALSSGNAGSIESPINNSKGCGGIMRMAPVGLVFPGRNEYCFKVGSDFAAFTHGHPSGYLSAAFFASLVSDLAIGTDLKIAISKSVIILKQQPGHEKTSDAIQKAVDLYFAKKHALPTDKIALAGLIEQLGCGWVGEEALAISLFCCLCFQYDFKSGVLAAVNHSGDSDSTGSITGNILGLINGIGAIPKKWISNLGSSDIVSQVAEDLHIGVKGDSFNIDMEWWNKYPGF